MGRRGSRFLRYLLVGLDAAALAVAWSVAAVVMSASGPSTIVASLSVIALVVGGVVFFNAIGLYKSRVCSIRTLSSTSDSRRGCLGVALT